MQLRIPFAPLRSPMAALRRGAAALVRLLPALVAGVLVLAVLAAPASLGGAGRSARLGLAVAGAAAGDAILAGAAAEATDPAKLVRAALRRCGAKLSDKERWQIADVIVNESDRHGYDPLFVQALVEVESTCRPAARSNRGAVGLIQVTPATARAVAADEGLRWRGDRALSEPGFNVRIGLRYLAQLEERFGDLYLAVAAYNLGPTQVARMPRQRARESRYVRRVVARYESLLARRSTAVL